MTFFFQTLCSGKGECVCGKCECAANYMGVQCEQCRVSV
jgi:hypothetical protein